MVCLSVTLVHAAKVVKRNKMLFEKNIWWLQVTHLLSGPHIPTERRLLLICLVTV